MILFLRCKILIEAIQEKGENMKIQVKSMLLFAALMLFDIANISAAAVAPTEQSTTTQTCAPQVVTVSVPIADIRTKNIAFALPTNSENTSFFYADNPLQDSQVLFGDPLNVIKEDGDWALVEIPKQKQFNASNALIPCSGWINKNAITNKTFSQDTVLVVKSLWAPIFFKTEQGAAVFNVSLGTKLFGKKAADGSWNISLGGVDYKIGDEHVQKIIKKRDSIKDMRVDLVQRASLFLTSPYNWGGASAPLKFYPGPMTQNMLQQAAGVDCSGLVHILFKSLGLTCPRNSNDQYLFSNKIESGSSLTPGDLIFFAKVGEDGRTPLRVTHVAIYAGKDAKENSLIIESQGVIEPYGVRLATTASMARLGNKQLSDVKTGDVFQWTDERNKTTCLSAISFGTFFTSQKLEDMRSEFLRN